MTGKQLKNSILQWAIQGKLVPQDPNDEPASVLLEKIRAEKARLIKEGKIKKDKNESIIYRGDDNSYYEKFADGKVVCIDEEIPFEIPSGWEWCRLGSLVDFSKSKSVKANNIDSDAWLLDLEDIEKDSGKLLHKKRKGTTTSISDKHRFERGNVLYSKLRPYLNKVIIADEDGYCTSEILCFDFGMIYNKYAQLFLMSPFFVEYAMSDAYGVKMPRLGSKQGNNGLIPIPPREEQTRIVNFINSLEPYIGKYSNAQASLDIINKEVKNTLKKSILQEAIQGKLVTQDNSEESASILLQRVKEEKLRLVKEGKLKKKDVVDSVIYKGDDNKYYEQIGKNSIDITDEIPFDVPENWAWCRIDSYVKLVTDYVASGSFASLRENVKYYKTPNYAILVKAQDFQNRFQKDLTYTDKHGYEFLSGSNLYGGELILSNVGSIGKVFVVPKLNIRMSLAPNSIMVKPFYENQIKWLYYLFSSDFGVNLLYSISSATAIRKFNKTSFKRLIIPIPPLAEQIRIVNQIEKIFSKIKGI